MTRRARVDRAAAVVDDARAPRARPTGQPASSTTGSRLPCSAQPGRTLAGRVGQRGPPVDADDGRTPRPARPRTSRRAVRRCRPRSASSARRRRPGSRTPWCCAAARTRGSRPATACPPTSRTAGSRRRPRPAASCRNSMVTSVERRHQRVPRVGLAEHHRLRALVIAAGSALDQIGRQRERARPRSRSAARHPARPPAATTASATGATCSRLKRFHRRDVGGGADRMRDHRSDVGHDVQVDARRAQRHHDVGEQDRGVDAVPAHRLQRDLAISSGSKQACQHACSWPAAPGTRAASGRPGA